MGLNHTQHPVVEPCLVQDFEGRQVVQIACGEANYALTKDGDVYAWGLYGNKIVTVPKLILKKSNLRSISTSLNSLAAAVDNTDRVWLWNPNPRPTVSLHDTSDNTEFPKIPEPFSALKQRYVSDVCVGNRTLFALGKDIMIQKVDRSKQTSQCAVPLSEEPEFMAHTP